MIQIASSSSSALLGHTQSVCPVCFERIPAERIAEHDDVYLSKVCSQHGTFKTLIWRGVASYRAWGARHAAPASSPRNATPMQAGCPYVCGLCTDHQQHTCCAVLDVTARCNLRCPVCFASASSVAPPDPTMNALLASCRHLMAHSGPVGIHLSGGEPTVRNDLPQIIREIRALGFTYIQLNTNGLRLAHDAEFTADLQDAGLSSVFLQFDGITNDVYQSLRGRPLLAEKLQAIRNCGEHGLGVVLVPTLVRGSNTHQVGAILHAALSFAPTVRAVHFQPVSYFGRIPNSFDERQRITIPEVLQLIEAQTDSKFRADQFYPASGENPYCEFHGKFRIGADGAVTALTRSSAASCCGASQSDPLAKPGEGARRAQRFVAGNWTSTFAPDVQSASLAGLNVVSFDALLAEREHSFCISGMAFQDAWNLDLERLRECFLHVYSADRTLIPLCAYHLTSATGARLYRHAGAAFAGEAQ